MIWDKLFWAWFIIVSIFLIYYLYINFSFFPLLAVLILIGTGLLMLASEAGVRESKKLTNPDIRIVHKIMVDKQLLDKLREKE